jgi:hypothetical protein
MELMCTFVHAELQELEQQQQQYGEDVMATTGTEAATVAAAAVDQAAAVPSSGVDANSTTHEAETTTASAPTIDSWPTEFQYPNPPLISNSDLKYYFKGLKIIGDPNVPGNQYSFRVDLSAAVDFLQMVQEDNRVIIMIAEMGAVDAVDIMNRIPLINGAFRGQGQINKRPGRWSPEWVPITMIVYHAPLTPSGAVFSIIWDDEGDMFMHMMDFTPFNIIGSSGSSSGAASSTVEKPITWSDGRT